MLSGLRLALRRLRATPGFTAVAVVTLALGIGANSAVFGLINRILLRPLPVERSHELVSVNLVRGRNTMPAISYPNYQDFRDRNSQLSGLVAYRIVPMSLSAGGQNSRLWGYTVSGNYFEVLGVKASIGRLLTPADDQKMGAHPVLVLSHACWQGRFGGDPRIAGRNVKINGLDFTVLGVAPPGFTGTELFYAADAWAPITMTAQIEPGAQWLNSRGSENIFVQGRMKPGVNLPQAEAELNAIAGDLGRQYPTVNEGMKVRLTPPGLAGSLLRGPVLGFTGLLLGVTGLVLLIACTNLAGLLLARGADRKREIGIRLALGASRVSLVRQMLAESLTLAICGGALGLLLAIWLGRLFAAWRPPIELPLDLRSAADGRMLLFTLGISVLACVLFGLTPAIQVVRSSLTLAIRNAGSQRLRRWALRDFIVAVQIGLSVVLLSGSVLVLRSLRNALDMKIGFDPRNAVIASFDLSLEGYDEGRGREFQKRLAQRVLDKSGLESVALADRIPLGLNFSKSGVTAEGKPVPKASEIPNVFVYTAAPGYFRTMRTRILVGREFEDRDRGGPRPVAVVNQALAELLWPGEQALGRRLRYGIRGQWMEIVGIVETGKHFSLGEAAEPALWEPLEQNYSAGISVLARSPLPGDQALALIRSAVLELDPRISFYQSGTVEDHMRLPLLPARIAAIALSAFGALTLLLAAIGVYGLLAYAVGRRTKEIGIRVALGASRGEVIRTVIGRTAVLITAGIALGGLGASAAGPFLSGILYEVNPRDPLTIAAAAVLMCAIGAAASWIPGRRAMAVDPAVALRDE